MSRAIYGMYVLLMLSACAVGTVTIIVDAGHSRLLRSLANFRRMKPTTVASFQLEGYVSLPIHVDPTGILGGWKLT